MIGTGGSIYGVNNSVSLRQIRPNQHGAYVFVEGIARYGSTPDFEVWAYAVCAKAPLGWHVVIDGNDYSLAPVQSTSVACPDDQQVLGAGFTKGDNQGVWPSNTSSPTPPTRSPGCSSAAVRHSRPSRGTSQPGRCA